MRNKKVVSILLTLLLLFGVLSLTVTSAAAADELGTAQAGDKVAVTGGNGHQYFYADSAGNSGYYWASYMTVAISERNGADVDYVNGVYKSYYAWCASYGEDVPKATQEYLLIDGQKDENGDYYYVDEALSQNGVKGLKIPFWWALSVIKSAERLAIQNGHASYDYRGTVVLPVSYRFAVEVAIRCISDEINANEQDITYGYGSYSGEQRLQEVGWTVADFYKAVKDIYNGAVNKPFKYEPPITEIIVSPTAINQYEGSYLILGRYSLNVSGAVATLTGNTTAGVEAVVDGNTLTVRIAKEKISKDVVIDWGVDLSYTNGQTYTMLFGLPIDKNGNVLDTPQNIMLYDAEPFTAPKSIEGRYNPWEEKATVTVQKTDENGKALSGMKFELYKCNGATIALFDDEQTDQFGKLQWKDLDLGDYFLVENCEGTGYEPHKPEEWQIDGATSAVYTTIGGKSGWKISLAPGDVGATVSAVNKQTETSLLVEKSTTDDSAPQGFKFTLYPVNANGTLGAKKQGTTNASGLLFFSPLELGTYFLVENCEGTGYAPHKPEQWQIGGVLSKEYTTINGMQGWKLQLGTAKAWVYADNYKIPTLSLNKTDRDGKPIKGMEFSIYTLSGDIPLYIDSFKTDKNGYINFEIKETGSYFIIEERNGKWEAFKPNEWRVVGASSAEYTAIRSMKGWLLYLDEGDNAGIEAVNDYTVSLTLKKQSTAGKTLEGATFALEVSFDNGESFSLLESKTTPESGVITFENLDRYAVYRVTETKAPTGYALLGDAVFVGRIAQEDITLTVGDSLILMMPSTGGNGTWIATLIAVLLAISAGWLMIAARKRTI